MVTLSKLPLEIIALLDSFIIKLTLVNHLFEMFEKSDSISLVSEGITMFLLFVSKTKLQPL